MKANEAPEKIYIHPDIGGREFLRPWLRRAANDESVEYTRTDTFIEKMARFLENKLYDRVEIQVFCTVIPSLTSKKAFIEDFRKYMKGE